jgi:hypothetical protein
VNFTTPPASDGFWVAAGSTLRDVIATSSSAQTNLIDAVGGTVERVSAHSSGTGTNNYTCVAGQGAVYRDSVCWFSGSDDPTFHSNSALGAFAQVPTDAVTLRNVTIYADNAIGLHSVSQIGNAIAVSATNTIAHGGSTDVRTSDFTPAGGPHVHTVALDHSHYVTTVEETVGDISPAPGTGTNQTGPLAFVDAANGDFREAPTSLGTLDLGTATGLSVGALDPDGGARVVGPLPDIGAYESTAPASPGGGGTTPIGTSQPAVTPAAPKKKCKKKKSRAAAAKKCKKKK